MTPKVLNHFSADAEFFEITAKMFLAIHATSPAELPLPVYVYS